MKQWESTLIGPEATLEEAIATLDREALRIVMVVSAERRLLGTLTDGDVRRALLKHMTLNVPVAEVMCITPRTAARDWSKERILADMEKYQLLQLPVVDQTGRVIGLETLHDLLNKRHRDNPVFLMAGGFGTRLQPLTHNCPKPLLKVGDKPILELILENFINAGFHRFFISTHYMPEMIREHFGDGSQWGVSIRYVHEEEPLGTGGALGLLPHNEIDQPLFMMNGDLLTTLNFQNLLEFHQDHSGVATMCVREYEHCVPYGVIQSEGHRICSMVEKPVHRFFINAGIYLLSPDLVKSVAPGVRIDMPTLLEREIANGNDVNMFPVHEYWLDIGRMEDFKRAQSEINGILKD
ncbi:nucleotidyltransferase family protein [Stutzerimonas frequens]|jgi:dTDP-glucose pyrophosphorylase|uniref:nucleotidyltransferase family protein n=1 Tax=Stutzerimonas frequens TaxID=2968969 RepID=UPI000C58293C|nr:nucleotidyltransferase family protein [Stutzerimonas frequens]MAL91682.1 alcohol dehydrogenase [Pseudomonas sp.]MBK3758372.1 CBS domain-containing protein [Stutzerimonas frequens]MDL0440188.1 nucleotidyltransferase family protein [Stutzerimonas frequens]WCR43669.1 nucleotidyltransferase family protein [Stutzerimonas stutzeri]|tara:strand:- start:12926 stop:13981 length:1056 start_codon:yes stop_codon:yes gene_type:complete